MITVWFFFRKESLFAVYGLCIQAIIEGGMKYYSVCKRFKKNIVPVKNYVLLWLPVGVIRIVVDVIGWQYSFVVLILSTCAVLVWNATFAMQDPMIKKAIIEKMKK